MRKTADRIIATFDSDEYYYDSLSYGIKLQSGNDISIRFILGLLNSKLLNYLHGEISDNKDKVFAKVLATNLSKLPIPLNVLATNRQYHDKIVELVDIILSVYKEKLQTTLPEKLESLQHRISYTDDKINQLVYKLYGLTEEEIKIVENQSK